MNEDLVKYYFQYFKDQYSDLFITSTLGGIIKVEYQMEPEIAFFVEIGEKDWIGNLISPIYHGIKIYKSFK